MYAFSSYLFSPIAKLKLIKGSTDIVEFANTVKESVAGLNNGNSNISNGANNRSDKSAESRLITWLRHRSEGIQDEVIGGAVAAVVFLLIGYVTENLQGDPIEWFQNSPGFFIWGVITIAVILVVYWLLQRRVRKRE